MLQNGGQGYIGITQPPPKDGLLITLLHTKLFKPDLERLSNKALQAPSFGEGCVISSTDPYTNASWAILNDRNSAEVVFLVLLADFITMKPRLLLHAVFNSYEKTVTTNITASVKARYNLDTASMRSFFLSVSQIRAHFCFQFFFFFS